VSERPSERCETVSWPARFVILGAPLLLFVASNAIIFQLGPGQHYLDVFRSDLFYYLANARELFENGNGVFYSDPFSASFSGPRVFSHLGLLIFGWTWRLTGISLPHIWQAGQILFGVLMLLSLHHLLNCLVERRHLTYTFAVIALGGGTGWIASLWAMAGSPEPLTYLTAFAKNLGTAFLPNVFRNTHFATQAFYHALAFATFAAVVTGRRGWALLGVFMVWWCHPFTGLEVAAIVGAHATVESAISRDRRALGYAAGVGIIGGAFVAYYLVLLPQWSEEAADILQRWRRMPFFVPIKNVPVVWGVFLLWPLFLLSRSLRPLRLTNMQDRFLLVWFLVAAALIFHDRLLPDSFGSYQPAHFTHGYLFVPMAILTMRGLTRMAQSWSSAQRRVAAVVFLAIATADSWSFAALETLPYRRFASVMPASEKQVADFLADAEPPGLVLRHELGRFGQIRLNPAYLSAVTPHRFYLFNELQTPYYERKLKAVDWLWRSPDPARGAAELGIRWIVEPRSREELDAAITTGDARIAFSNTRYRVVEILVSPERPPLQ
jgi:hypothetical protein